MNVYPPFHAPFRTKHNSDPITIEKLLFMCYFKYKIRPFWCGTISLSINNEIWWHWNAISIHFLCLFQGKKHSWLTKLHSFCSCVTAVIEIWWTINNKKWTLTSLECNFYKFHRTFLLHWNVLQYILYLSFRT